MRSGHLNLIISSCWPISNYLRIKTYKFFLKLSQYSSTSSNSVDLFTCFYGSQFFKNFELLSSCKMSDIAYNLFKLSPAASPSALSSAISRCLLAFHFLLCVMLAAATFELVVDLLSLFLIDARWCLPLTEALDCCTMGMLRCDRADCVLCMSYGRT